MRNIGTKGDRVNLLIRYSYENINKPTQAEDHFLFLLYQVRKYLRYKDIDFGHISRQKVVHSNTALTGYIVDYYIQRINLVFEIDGGYHEKRKEYDYTREEYLKMKIQCGIIRYKNEEVFQQGMRDRLREDILSYIAIRYPKGNPDLAYRPLAPGTIREHRYKSHMKERHLYR